MRTSLVRCIKAMLFNYTLSHSTMTNFGIDVVMFCKSRSEQEIGECWEVYVSTRLDINVMIDHKVH